MTSSQTELELDVVVKNIGVVIPAYNAEKTIARLVEKLIDYGFRKDKIIVINDGSQDKTYKIIKGVGVTVVNHTKNIGKGASLRDGFDAARQKKLHKVFTIDADAQHQVSEISEFLKLNNQYDIIIGERKDILSRMPLDRRLTNKTVNLVVSLLSGMRTTDVQCGFRYLNLRIFDKIRLKTKNYQTESEMVIKAARNKYRVGFVPITTIYGNEKSYVNPIIDTIRFINMTVRFLWR